MNRDCLKIRLYPDRAQKCALEATLETCRLVYNSLVNDRKFQYDSVTFTQNDSFKVGDSTIRLAKIGQVKAKLHRKPWGELKIRTVRRMNGKWFACLCQAIEAEHLPPSASASLPSRS